MHRTEREALAAASGIVSTMVGAVTLANIAPDAATAGAILKNAQALIKERYSSGGSLRGSRCQEVVEGRTQAPKRG
jgi:hypothetical protein